MALNTQLYESSPYFDDYASSNVEAKGYLKMLFKPGLSVQTRELNQLQTMLQTQVERFGLNIFQNGSPVLDGVATFNNDYTFIDVTFTDADLQYDGVTITETVLQNRLNQLLKVDVQDSLSADVIRYEPLILTTAETRYRLYLRYTKQLSEENVFPNNSILRSQSPVSDGSTQLIFANNEIANIVKVGFATQLTVEKGVYFVNGYFVNVEKTQTYVEKPSADYLISGRVSFLVEEKITNYTTDATLLDNAAGYPNDTAPGADRYGIQLTLVLLTDQAVVQNYSYNTNKVYPLTGNIGSTKFIELLTIERGLPIYPLSVKYNSLSERLGGTFAKRTYEESGNYCLKPFITDVREAYNDGGNRGRLTATNATEIATLKSRYCVGVEPSIAYVEGYRVELINKTEIVAEKARDQVFGESVYMSSGKGTYIEGTFENGSGSDPADILIDGTFILYDDHSSPAVEVAITGIEYLDKSGVNTQYRLYINIVSGRLSTLEGLSVLENSSGVNVFQSTPLTPTFKVYGDRKSNKIIKLPRDVISSVNTSVTEFAVRKKYTGTIITSGDVELTAAAGEKFFNNDVNDYIVHDSVGGILTVTDVSIASGGATVALTLSATPTGTVTVFATTKTSANLATKTPTLTSLTYNDSPSGVTTGEVIDLGQTDVYEIVSIASNESPEDVIRLSDFVFDNGQRESSYQNSTLTYIGTSTLGSITILFRYFAHSNTTSPAYFSRESYPATFDYAKIPSYKGTRLSDVFDFRHANGLSIDPNSIIETEIDYYLPRYDQLIVNTKGEFGIVKGVSSLNPKVPVTPRQAMALYNFFLPAYTFDTKSIQSTYIDNRRYTMRDIGKIEKRLSIMEYYTSLSLLEQEASDQKIFDEEGERFKNGIIVDSFSGHKIGNVFDPGYRCAMDGKVGVLRPSYEYNHLEYTINGDNGDDFVHLPSVSIQNIIEQPYASVHESVMPYDVIYYSGNLTLSPSSDNWKETRRRPDVLINFDGNADAIEFLLNASNAIGTQWGDWENNWSGTDANTSTISDSAIRNDITGSVSDTVLTNDLLSTSPFITTRSRSGISTEITVGTITQDISDRIVDVTYVPFIRARRIFFRATNLKPNTHMNVYVDETNVTGYSTKLDNEDGTFDDNRFRELPLPGSINDRVDFFDLNADEVFTTLGVVDRDPLITDATGTLEGYFIIPNNEAIRFRTGERIITLSDADDGVGSIYATSTARATYSATGLILDAENTVISTRTIGISQSQVIDTEQVAAPPLPPLGPLPPVGEIAEADPVRTARVYPNVNSIIEGESFTIILETENVPTGTAVNFTIGGFGIDQADFDGLPAEVTSWPNGAFTVGADGTDSITFNTATNADFREIAEAFRLTLTDPEFATFVSPVRGVLQNQARVTIRSNVGRIDPLAQSFYLADAGIEDGAFLSSVDLFFKQKHGTLPVSIEIVTVENGIPTQKLVPMSQVTVQSNNVNVSDDASLATTFTFEAPLFLSSDTEYAFIVRSNSIDYRVWMSETGGTDVLSGDRISKDPYVGVSYKSANASTWTPTQERDIKFTLKAHTFMSSTETTRVRTVGSGTVTETGTGPFIADFDSSFSMTAFKLQAEQLILPRTDITYRVTVGSNTYPVQLNKTIYLPSQVTINSASDLLLSADLRTNNRFLTPMIDLDRLSIVCINNVINNDATNETSPTHGNAVARYITRKVELENPSNRLSIYLNANRPSDATNIQVYARFNAPFSSPAIDDLSDAYWIELETSPIPVNSRENEFNEILYESDPDYDFTQFQVKIVLLSSQPAQVPTVNDVRAIATV